MAKSNIKQVKRVYSNFKGVDFSNSDVSLYRSPNAVNMWKNYNNGEGIETRPGMTLLGTFSGEIFGLFFYTINNSLEVIVHSGTKLYKWTNYPESPVETTILFNSMKPSKSQAVVIKDVLFIKDGLNYLEYNGTTCSEVVGTIPITRLGATPSGQMYSDDTDYIYQDVNILSNLRKNGFVGDGESTEYHLDTTNLDSASTYIMKATVNGIEKTEGIDFTVDRTNGVVNFNTAPSTPTEDGDSNVIITYSKSNNEYKKRVLESTQMIEFDNRLFFSGNNDYPNAVFHSELEDPRYVRDTAYYNVGIDLSPVRAMIPGNDILWIFKDTNQNSSNAYYMTPTIDNTYGKVYPVVSGSISTGCISTGTNFNDDIVFFSTRGLEAIGNTLGNDNILTHRSSLVDSKLITQDNYKNVVLAEYRGYLMCLINGKIFLADSRQRYQRTQIETEYEWFYWELYGTGNGIINYMTEYRNDLYLGNKTGQIFILEGTTDNGNNIISKWTTSKDTFGYDAYRKITNKRGGTASLKSKENDSIKVKTITENRTNEIGTYEDTKEYIVYRVKEKKFKWIQIEFSSTKPFGMYSCTLEAYITGYVKR